MERIKYKGKELLPIKRDLVFKAVFVGDGDLELLASLLSSIIDLDINADDLTITNTEIPPVYETGKLSRLDIRVRTADKKHINIEIQLRDEHNIDKRSIFYLSKLYIEQMTAGMRFDEICQTIAINILDFSYLPFDEYHNRYRMKNTKNNSELTDIFEINFIELPKASQIMAYGLKDLWVRFLAADSEEVLDMLASKEPIFEKAMEKLIYVSADEKLRYELDMREKAELDYWSAMKTNYEKGEQKGKLEGKLEVALNIIRELNISIAKAMEITSLSISEREKLIIELERHNIPYVN